MIGNPENAMDSPPLKNHQASSNVQGTSSTASSKDDPSIPSIPAPDPRHSAPNKKETGKGVILPIEALSPYQNKWVIKARVIQKSDLRTWSNVKGEGKLFTVILADESGEIKGTAFNRAAEGLHCKLEQGKVYHISKARVNLAKKEFSRLSHQFELALEIHTEINECVEVTTIPTLKYNFTTIDRLSGIPKDSTCDVIGIVKDTSDVAEIFSKTGQRILKRELTLIDTSEFSICLTLWGGHAQQYNSFDAPVVAFKDVKVGDFGGRSLMMTNSSVMTVNPEVEQTLSLRQWYKETGTNRPFKTHTAVTDNAKSISAGGFNRSNMYNLHGVKDAQLGLPDRASVFSTQATIMHIRPDMITYPACRTPACNKKMVKTGNNWICNKCNSVFSTPDYKYVVTLAVSDWTGQVWLQGFNDVGGTIFGMSANELVKIQSQDEEKYTAIIRNAVSEAYNFRCRAKQDHYNGESRIRYGIAAMAPLDYKEEARTLRDFLHTTMHE